MHYSEHQLVIVSGARPAHYPYSCTRRQEMGEVLGHVDTVIEVWVDDRCVDVEARSLETDNRHAMLSGVGHGSGRLGGIDRVKHDRVHAGSNALTHELFGTVQPSLDTEVGVPDAQLDARLPKRVVKGMTHRVDG